MNTILEQINSAGGFFVEFAVPMLVQSSVLIVILLLADFLLRKKVRAVFRYCIWMLVLVKLVLPSSLSSPMSVGYWFGDTVGTVKLSSPPASVNPVSVPEATEAGPMETASAAPVVTPKTGEAIVEPVASVTPVTWQGAVFLVWLAVVIAMGLLLLQRAIFVSGLVAQAKKANNLMNDALKFCCRCMEVNGKIGLKVSANATSPAVCGLFRPVILVPENLAPSLGAGHLRTVLLHELAHIKRGDLWVNLAQTILQIIYFYNPLLWLANCIIRRVREQAVDEAVQVAMGEKAKQYPETLVNVAKVAFKRPTLSLRLIGVVESKSTLQARIKRMLNRPIPKTAKLGILGLIAVIIFAAVLLPMAGAMSGPPTFTVNGTVTDAETGQPIAGAKVGDVERYAEGKQWTTTDSNGNYSYKTWYEEHAVKCEIAGYETQIKGFLPKLFGLDLEKERVVDFKLTPENPENSSRFIATLPNGVTVELIGVCEHPSKGKQWWRPDGGILEKAPYEKTNASITPMLGRNALGAAIKIEGFNNGIGFRYKIEGVKNSASSGSGDQKVYGIAFDQAKGKNETDIKVGIAAGQWKTVMTQEPEFDGVHSYKEVIWHGPSEKDGKTVLHTAHTLIDKNTRVIAIDQSGKEHTGGSHSAIKEGLESVQTTFRLPLSQIEEFKFQTRLYEWVEFKNVSLKPNFKTNVQVEGKEVSGITEVDITPADFDIRLDSKRGLCNLMVSIQNKKNVNIPKFKLRFYRGNPANNLDEAGNVHTGWHEAGPIEPGKSWNERTRDFHLADGQYEFHAVLDYDDNVPEVDENNNQAVLKVTIKNGRIIEKSVSYSPRWNKKKTDMQVERAGKRLELSYDDGSSAGKWSFNDSGHAVQFETPEGKYYLKAVKIYGSRYGQPRPPKEDFHVWLCDTDFNIIEKFDFPYSRFRRGNPKWVTLRTKPTLVPEEFIICVGFNAGRTKGVYVHYDSGSDGKSFTALPGGQKKEFSDGDWMVRAVVSTKRTAPVKDDSPAEPIGTAPVVIESSPENYSDNVPPGLDRISVTFDQKMTDKNYSWVRWNYPFPETTRKAYYDQAIRKCTLPVKLEQGKAYLVRINAAPYENFVSSQDIPAIPYVLVFATQDENGNVTPIPQEMLDFARFINSKSEQFREKTEGGKQSLLELIDSARPGGTVIVPKGVYTEPIEINKSLTLKGQSRTDCIFEVTADRPAIFVDTKGKGRVTIEGLTIKWRLATSNKNIEHPFAVAVRDTKAEVKNCSFLPLGNFKRSPVAVRAMGFSKVNISTCRFEGFGFAVFYNEGTEGAIRDSLIMNCQSQGITIFRGATVDIVGNIIAGSKKHAVRNTGGTLFMKDNLIIENANRGIYLGNKSARGAITNNIIMGNGTGISGFAQSKVKIENNVIADSSYAGIGMRNSCSLLIRDNIFQGNERGWILFEEGSRGGNTVYRNTFWKNKVDAENFRKTANSIAAEPRFVDAANGDFSLKPGPAKEHSQGLTNPEVFKSLWKIWQNRSDKNELFIGSESSRGRSAGRRRAG